MSADSGLQELVASTAEAAYVSGPDRTVLAWNDAATRLLGHDEPHVVGLRCWQLLAGTDVHGNKHCGPGCPIVKMVQRRQPVHDFAASLRSADGAGVCVRVTAVGVPLESGERAVLHILHPCRWEEPMVEEAGDGDRSAGPNGGAGSAEAAFFLTTRELEVLRLMGDGPRTDKIAALLFISPLTVRTHIQRILRKLGAHSKIEAVAHARGAGLL